MFRGRYEHKINGQGRISLPANYREALGSMGEGMLMVTNLEDCLVAYPMSTWLKKEEKFLTLSETETMELKYQRFYVSGATQCQVDKQGRILLPSVLRAHAELKKDVIFVGLTNRFEIWNKAVWDAQFEKLRQEFPDAAKIVKEKGL